jgi:hypothetical protein
MTPEIWPLVAILLMALAVVTRTLALLGVRGPWNLATAFIRLGAALALGVFLALLVGNSGAWSPLEWDQLMASLSIAILVMYQLMAWGFRVEGAAPLVDLLALALVVTGMSIPTADGLAPTCIQTAAPFIIWQGLFLVGTAAAAIMGSTGLMLGLQAGLERVAQGTHWPGRSDQVFFLAQANMLALLILGCSLVLSISWSWHTIGSLGLDDTYLAWMAITWLLAAMSNLARSVQRHWVGWLAILAVATTGTALFGLLVSPYLPGQF